VELNTGKTLVGYEVMEVAPHSRVKPRFSPEEIIDECQFIVKAEQPMKELVDGELAPVHTE